jgi:hypothetical protein
MHRPRLQAPQTAHKNEKLRQFYLGRFPHWHLDSDPDSNLQTVDCQGRLGYGTGT